MKFTSLLLTAFFLLFLSVTIGQQTFGTIVFKIDVEGKSEEAVRLKNSLSTSSVQISFNPHAIRVQTIINPESRNTSIIDKKSGDILVLIDKKKYKAAYFTNLTEIADLSPEIYEISFTDEKKTILGYPCKKVTAQDSYGNTNYYWFTKGIDYGVKIQQIPTEIPGVCLEYSMYSGKNKIIYSASAITKAMPEAHLFNFKIPEGYKQHYTGRKPVSQEGFENREK